MAHLRVRTLGKLHLQNGEERLEHFPTKRAEELLGYLLINQQAQLPREKLVELLWPDNPPNNGRANLSTTLWRLRTVFDQLNAPAADYLNTSRDWIAFSPNQPVTLDHTDFEKYLDKAEQTDSVSALETNLRTAIALYRGAFCEGIYAEWCLVERERLERRFIKALGRLMALHISREEFQQAVTLGKEILNRDHLREEAHRALMHCYWQLGQRSESVRQFQSCARLLQRELNVLPMPQTINLYRGIIEERISDYSSDGPIVSVYQERLDAAFENFLTAADELNSIIEETSRRPEPATSF